MIKLSKQKQGLLQHGEETSADINVVLGELFCEWLPCAMAVTLPCILQLLGI